MTIKHDKRYKILRADRNSLLANTDILTKVLNKLT